MPPPQRRGLLIAIEGCDRGGKTTQCKLLVEWLSNNFSLDGDYVKFPERGTPIGKIINEYLSGAVSLNDEAIHLLFSANRWELKEQLEQRINSGTTLVLDRYAPSGVAYSSAKGLELDWCKAPDNGLPKPDLVIFLDVPVQSTTNRAGFGEERYERLDFQILVRKRFEELWDDSWVLVDGTGTIEEVTQRVQQAVSDRIPSLLDKGLFPLDYLDW